MTEITAEKLVRAGLADQATAEKVAEHLVAACSKFEIDTALRASGFLSQCSHESAGFRVCQENLNYSAQALLRIFPKYFDARAAIQFERKPELIANKVYANRMGNGPEASGDGWKFHGRGFIQLTGHDNYRLFELALEAGAKLSSPDVLVSPQYAALSAAWFWNHNNLNKLADAGDVVGMTKRINGGVIGLDDRKRLYAQAIAVFV